MNDKLVNILVKWRCLEILGMGNKWVYENRREES